jgi:hypothetical protein
MSAEGKSFIEASNPYRAELLRGVGFDLTYIAGIGSLALLMGWAVTTNPQLFLLIFLLNGWSLGYHHVVSTFTRLSFDRDSFGERRFLITKLPLIVLAGVLALGALFGAWILSTVYLYWQWWHYTRQSYGISRIYQRKAGLPNDLLSKLIIYALPLWGILHRSYQRPSTFLFVELKVIPVPFCSLQWPEFLPLGFWLGGWPIRSMRGSMAVFRRSTRFMSSRTCWSLVLATSQSTTSTTVGWS